MLKNSELEISFFLAYGNFFRIAVSELVVPGR